MDHGKLRVPATTANLGPGFDVLGLALDLWNEIEFKLSDSPSRVIVKGEGNKILLSSEYNLILRSVKNVYDHFDQKWPTNLVIECNNNIPIFSGLGSSAAAVLAGVLIANTLLGGPLTNDQLLEFCSNLEGHPDNIAPALSGGLTISIYEKKRLIVQKYKLPEWQVGIVLPDVRLSTKEARKVLPHEVNLSDAIYSLGRIPIVVDALRNHDMENLKLGMSDRLHEKHRLRLIPGAKDAIQAAKDLGAAATISGSGPSLIAFAIEDHQNILQSMQSVFLDHRIKSRVFILNTTNSGAEFLSN